MGKRTAAHSSYAKRAGPAVNQDAQNGTLFENAVMQNFWTHGLPEVFDDHDLVLGPVVLDVHNGAAVGRHCKGTIDGRPRGFFWQLRKFRQALGR
ncbi:MAG TPA: hypothetical protein VLX58_11705 [Bryobacteraceae bacterium]|nr:hypothetical protein [Bryobacteraceae bacterium]